MTLHHKAISGLLLVLCLIMYGADSQAQQQTLQTIATIVLELEHFPSAAQAATLTAINSDPQTTDAERVLATALLTMQHRVTEHQRQALQALIADPEQAADVRSLAVVIRDLEHQLNDFQRQQIIGLQGMANP